MSKRRFGDKVTSLWTDVMSPKAERRTGVAFVERSEGKKLSQFLSGDLGRSGFVIDCV